MKLAVPLLILLLTSSVQAKTLKIAVVDSGLDLTDYRLRDRLCTTGHKDFTGVGIEDTLGHGTQMAGLIEQYAGKGDYCLLIYKYYQKGVPGYINIRNELKAFKQAILDGASIINFSSSGEEFDEDEYNTIKDNPYTTFVVAAGNDGLDLGKSGNYAYPASYFLPNEIVVGNINSDGNRAEKSNYGSKINVVEVGTDVKTTDILEDEWFMGGHINYSSGYAIVSGTSESTAIHTGKLIRKILDANK